MSIFTADGGLHISLFVCNHKGEVITSPCPHRGAGLCLLLCYYSELDGTDTQRLKSLSQQEAGSLKRFVCAAVYGDTEKELCLKVTAFRPR